MAESIASMSAKAMSVRKPRRPWLMPMSGTPKGARRRAADNIVPSPPTTIPSFASRPISEVDAVAWPGTGANCAVPSSSSTRWPRAVRKAISRWSGSMIPGLAWRPTTATVAKGCPLGPMAAIRTQAPVVDQASAAAGPRGRQYNNVMLDPRAQHLLKTLIERYIADGQPVGSRVLSRQSGLELSPATIRNVMADLEDMGFIASPHTSAGRVPTPKGYRLFVDSLLIVKPLEEVEINELQEQLQADRPQLLVNAAAQMLSQLTHYAGVVATPRRREASFRHIEFLRLSERRVLLIIVTAEGDVQNRILHTDRAYTQAQLLEASNFLNQHYAGQPFHNIRALLAEELRQLREDVVG